jgi:hypothetical protein
MRMILIAAAPPIAKSSASACSRSVVSRLRAPFDPAWITDAAWLELMLYGREAFGHWVISYFL